MEFNKAYNREEFLSFLRVNFLPEDFKQEEQKVNNPVHFQYTKKVTRLGECDSLELVVYEVRHSSKHDARVGLTKEAFRLLAEEFCQRALVFFVPEDDNSNYRFSLIEITLDQSEDSSRVNRKYSNPHRYSYYLGKGIAYYTPNKYLNEYGRVLSVDDLRNRFSVDVLTKAFYQELSDWYAWAIPIVQYPNNLKDLEDNQKYNSEALIRLITRLIFVWFLKQRHLVPDEFFDEKFISNHLLKSFTPNAKVNLFGKSEDSHYYKGILQNLFFAMLNSPITPEGGNTISERRFRSGRGDYDNNKLMRYKSLFANPDLFVELANKYVPFLNGGLFDCLDDKDNGIYIDAFTDRESVSKQLIIPDYLFFGEDVGKNVDLSKWYGDKKKKKVSARGIIDILKRYNFTVEENTPFDQEVSLDPELLGKVFENLLAAYNPETQTTARSQTGSFYTPREIVQYMVDESLIAHLKSTVGESLEQKYRELLEYTDEEPSLTNKQKADIIRSIYNCKVLDPACGSGAFPMGMLQQMVHILNRIDPDNKMWKDMMLKNAINETSEAYRNASSEERSEIVNDIERSFNESINRPDYARKLYLIENCIYGVDIQPIAIQISKLRFFISLVVDQKTNNNPVDNFGIRPLPNLEAKFVAANTLIGIEKKDTNLFTSEEILKKEAEMKDAKHRIFGSKTVKTKRKYKERVTKLREELALMLKGSGAVGNDEARMLATWDMFDQNATSDFFDSEWMFGVNNNFDIVISNPPYIDSESMTNQGLVWERRYLQNRFSNLSGNWDIYMAFFEIALLLGRIVTYITPDKWLSKPFGLKFRKNRMRNRLSLITRAGSKVFESATVDAIITLFTPKSAFLQTARFTDTNKVSRLILEDISNLEPPYLIDSLFSDYVLLMKKIEKTKGKIRDIAVCEGSCATSDFYVLKELIKENQHPNLNNYFRLINTGTIEKYRDKWADKEISYGGKFKFPVINKSEFSQKLGASYNKRANSKKIIFKGLNLLDGCLDERAEIIPGKSTLVICDNSIPKLKFLLGFLNSKLPLFYIRTKYASSSYCGGITFSKEMINDFPLTIAPEQSHSFISLVNKILSTKKKDPQADTSALEKEIDKKVYHHYNLTYKEVLMVDPDTPITKEEYESQS